MNIPFSKYDEIIKMIDEMEGTEESIERFITKFINFTGVKKIQLAEDDVFEIENLDFQDIDALKSYFTIQPIIDKNYCDKLYELALVCNTREDFCKEATDIVKIPVKQYGVIVRLNNIDFEKKNDLLDYLSAYKVFNKLSALTAKYKISEDGRGILLDGIAYVHDSKRDMLDNPKDLPIEGYLSNNEVKWVNVDKDAFTKYSTGKGDVYILKHLSEENIKTIYKKKPKELGITEKPYPIAILSNNKYAYAFKS